MVTKPVVALSSKKIVLVVENEELHVGVDTHKNSYHVAIWSAVRQRIIAKWVQPADARSLIRKLQQVGGTIVTVTYEAGPTGFELARLLLESGFNAQVIAPSHTPQARAGEKKCDPLDACKLAKMAAQNDLTVVRIPTRQQEQRRQLTRTRSQIVKAKSRIKVQIKSFLLMHSIPEPQGLASWSKAAVKKLTEMKLDPHLRFALDLNLAEYHHQVAQQKRVDAELEKLAQKDDVAPGVEILRSIPYFGRTGALIFLLEMHAMEKFETSRAVARYLGLAPKVERSGEGEKHLGLFREGNRHLKSALIEAAWRWVTHDDKAREIYRYYLLKTAKKQKAIVAVARRLGIMAWHLLMTGTKYDPARVKTSGARTKAVQKHKAQVMKQPVTQATNNSTPARSQRLKSTCNATQHVSQ